MINFKNLIDKKDIKSIMNIVRFIMVWLSAILLIYCVVTKKTNSNVWMAGLMLLLFSSIMSIVVRHMK